jgi:SAM-dependent methyltransferase
MSLIGFDLGLTPARLSPLDRLRHVVTAANLARHLDDGPHRVLDVAGGNGVEAVRLAALGHEVTVLDPAGAMLDTAIRTAENHDVTDRLHVVQAGALDAPEVFAEPEFDVVLCHNLLHLVDTEDRPAVLDAILAPLRPGGLLSVLGPNTQFEPLHLAVRAQEPDRALAELAAPPADPAAEIVGLLVDLGVEEVVRYGVRCVSDLIPSQRGTDPAFLADLERLEITLADRMPHLLTAALFHLIARR